MAEKQKPNKANKPLPVMEIFGPTYQGEGVLAGCQTYFIRFGLCDFDCTMCDSRAAVDPGLVRQNAKWMRQDEIFDALMELASKTPNGCHTVTLSGGNPCIHDLTILCNALHKAGWMITVETQGTKSPPWLAMVDLVMVSPKGPGMGELFDPEVFTAFMDHMNRLGKEVGIKIVLFDQRDLEFADLVFSMAPVSENVQHFFSLGNKFPPMTKQEVRLSKTSVSENDYNVRLKNALLEDYRTLCEDILQDARFHHVTFFPQLHVLIWGNAPGV